MMDFESKIIQLSHITFPEGTFKRDYVVPYAARSLEEAARYDRYCLAYDVFYDFEANQVILLCPKLLNFENVIRGADISSGPIKHKIQKIQRYRLYDVVYLVPTPFPERLEFAIEGFKTNIVINKSFQDFFSDCRALVAISKNNDLQWIKDWVEFHSKYHGADAVLLFDNGSDNYTLQDIQRILSSAVGMKKVVIVSAPFKYGPRLNRRKEKFLQEAMFNLGRLRLLNKCRSVLSVDIDELVICEGDKSIFKITEASKFGYSLFFGGWRYVSSADNCIRHKDHFWKRSAESENLRTKYCIAPQGRLGSKSWSIHNIRGIPRWLQYLMHVRSAKYLHCKQISTSWKYNRLGEASDLVEDPRAFQIMSRVFSDC